jgi:uncharacterized membrane protein
MKLSLVFILSLIILSCGRVENSSSQDRARYSPNMGGSAEFQAALAVLSAKCSECHGSWEGFTESEFVTAGLVVANDPTKSKVYYRNQLGPGPSNNMPDSGRPAMTSAELQTIAEWINSVN